MEREVAYTSYLTMPLANGASSPNRPITAEPAVDVGVEPSRDGASWRERRRSELRSKPVLPHEHLQEGVQQVLGCRSSAEKRGPRIIAASQRPGCLTLEINEPTQRVAVLDDSPR